MKKKITLISLLLLLASNGFSYAQTTSITNNDPDVTPVKVAISSDIIMGAVKSGLYTLGTALLNKYVSPNTTYVYSNGTTSTTDTSTTSDTSTSQTNATQNSAVQDSTVTNQTTPDQPEQMIPVS